MEKNQIIMATALELFVLNGFHGTATSKIAQDSGVANGTLFNYFPTKEFLIVSIYNNIIKNMDEFLIENMQMHSVSRASFYSLFQATINWNLNNPIEFQYVQQFISSPFSKSNATNVVNDKDHPLYLLLQNGIDLVVVKSLPVSLLFSLFIAQIKGLFFYIISNDIPMINHAAIIEETFELLWKMIEE